MVAGDWYKYWLLVLVAGSYQYQRTYQDALRTPGIIPCSDSSRKQIRHSPKRRRNARERPHRPQRLCFRTSNFGFRLLFSIMALRAIVYSRLKVKIYCLILNADYWLLIAFHRSTVPPFHRSTVPPSYIALPPFLSSDRN